MRGKTALAVAAALSLAACSSAPPPSVRHMTVLQACQRLLSDTRRTGDAADRPTLKYVAAHVGNASFAAITAAAEKDVSAGAPAELAGLALTCSQVGVQLP